MKPQRKQKTARKPERTVTATKKKIQVQRCYKDTLFRMLFREKENLLSLYNAVNKTAYTDVDMLEVTTLENAVYMNYKNDISFVFDFELMLYEHQSTVNPNMPLRDLIYVTEVLQGLSSKEDLYGSRLIRLPAARFVICYNGTDFQPKQHRLRLSDAFFKKRESPELELTVTVYNINWGYNQELMSACRLLEEYAQYVDRVRQFAKTMPFEKAVEAAVEYCIKHDILADFLIKNRAEAIAMSIFEYDEERHIKSEREIWRKEGREEGLEEGVRAGVQALIEMGIKMDCPKQDVLEYMVEKMRLSQEKAGEYIERYWH